MHLRATRLSRVSGLITGVTAALAIVVSSSDAQAQGFVNRLAFRGELGIGAMISDHQRQALGYDGLGFEGTLRIGVRIFDPLSINLSFANWFFQSNLPAPNDGMGRVMAFTGGLRFEPRIGTVGRLYLEGNFGYAMTGEKGRLYLDAGLGFEFQVARAFAIGPMVRYGHVFQSNDYTDASGQTISQGVFDTGFKPDAQWIVGGLSATLTIPEDEVAPAADGDADGVNDADDQCPTTPQGDHPDPTRVGCPLTDTDGDGVFDNDDQCVNVPMGAHPDEARRGCPVSDQDSDGVSDGEDQCLTEPAGNTPDPARRGCPQSDQDNDGVYDADDQCPTVAQGPVPDPARRGCPIGDSDHDGIPDNTDRCPEQPETFNGREDTDGCPDGAALGVREGGVIRILEQIRFRTGSDVIEGARSFAIVDAVAGILRASPDITALDVQGHTDDRGNPERNRELSNRRAAAVVRALVERNIEAGRLTAHGFGPDRPLVQGTTPQARAANRRVEFHIGGS
jgi:outer membrane protein OmpA-like peptidoglycan-associated protein